MGIGDADGRVKKQKILIVEDEEEIRPMIDGFLGLRAFSMREALDVFQDVKPDVAILDAMLPDGDGFSRFHRSENIRTSRPFFTARGEDEDRLLGLGLGAYDYMVKPFFTPGAHPAPHRYFTKGVCTATAGTLSGFSGRKSGGES